MRTIASFSGEEIQSEKYNSQLHIARKIGIKKGFISGLSIGSTMGIMFLAYSLALYVGALWISDPTKSYTTGKVLEVFFAVVMGAFALGQASPGITALSLGQAAAFKAFETINRVPTIDSYSEEGTVLKKIEGTIEINDIHFKYPTRTEQKILNGLSLTVKPGQTVALVGHSGCGKSTLIQLIERFYDVEKGSISIDGHKIEELNVRSLRNCIGLVGQEPVLFNGTIAENIAYGKPGASQEEIEEAAKESNAHNFITKFPQGYKTDVGEKGSKLSGGQKQRIAIARALIKKPSLLLFDEATSALDNKSEKIVQKALEKVSKGITTIVIAHRLSTIRDCDNIFVLEKGVVAQSGTHEELMKKGGIYCDLVKLQGETQARKNDDENLRSTSEKPGKKRKRK